MTAAPKTRIPKILKSHEGDLLKEWIKQQLSGKAVRSDLMKKSELREQNQELLHALAEVERRQEELFQLNREIEDTNRGVMALYAELDEKADTSRCGYRMTCNCLPTFAKAATARSS